MSAITLEPTKTRPGLAVLRAETRLFLREPGALFLILVFPTLLLMILGSIPAFRKVDGDLGLRTIDLYVPILVLVALVMGGLQSMPPLMTGYRERGILRRMSLTPVRPSALMSAQMGLHGGAAVVSALMCLVVGRLVFDVRLPQQVFGYVVALILSAAASLALGALVSAIAPTAKITTAIGSVVTFPSLFCAGLWLPVQAMPKALGQIVVLTPFGAAARALDEAAAGNWPSWSHLGVLAVWTVVLTAAAARWFRWE
jgi:ABC-2 type transport system permease protein